MADILLAQTCCCDMASLSCLDLQLEMRADHSGDHDEEARLEHGSCHCKHALVLLTYKQQATPRSWLGWRKGWMSGCAAPW